MSHPQPGDTAPDFTLPSAAGGTIRLSDFRDRALVLLVFYPGDDTLICTRQLCSYTHVLEQYRRRGFEILAIGSDDIESHRRFAAKRQIAFPLLSDRDGAVCRQYGAWGALVKRPRRGLFLVDRAGIIRYARIELTRLFHLKADAVIELVERQFSAATS